MLKKINFLIQKKHKIKIALILFFLILSSILEILGIGTIPLMVSSYLDNNTIELIRNNSLFVNFENYLHEDRILFFFGFIIIFIFLIKNILLGVIAYFEAKILKNINEENALKLYRYYLDQNLSFFLNSNPNLLSRNIIIENQSVSKIVSMILHIIKELVILVGILLVLFYANWLLTLIIFLLLSFLAISYVALFKNKLDELGKSSQKIRGLQLTYLNQAFGAIKDIISC